MFDIEINYKNIKNFFCKKTWENSIITKRLLGVISLKYVRGYKYKEFIKILTYIKPAIKSDINIDLLIKNFKEKSMKNKNSAVAYQKDYETMQNIISSIIPQKLPCATGDLRSIQLLTLDLAKEVLSDLKQNTDIQIWLDGGTLLGAVRHAGFIPWDDDMDFAVMRKDYQKLKDYFINKYIMIDTSEWDKTTYRTYIADFIEKYPNQIIAVPTFDAFKLIKGTPEKFIILDFFAWDYYNDIHNVVTLQEYTDKMREKMSSIVKYYDIQLIYEEEFQKKIDIVEKSNVIGVGIDNHGFYSFKRKGILHQDDIFPLKKIKFEDWEFYAPNNSHEYLKSLYNFYNKIPVENLNIFSHVNTKDLDSTL